MGKDARGIFLRVEVVCGLRLAIGLIIYSYIRLKNHLSNKSWNIHIRILIESLFLCLRSKLPFKNLRHST